MTASGAVTWATQTFNGGWWDPGGYWYTNGPNVWEARMVVPAVPAGLSVTNLDLYVDDGDLGDGMSHKIVIGGAGGAGGTVLYSSANQGQHGIGPYQGGASIGLHFVGSWATSVTSPPLGTPTDLRYRVLPASTGNQQHYLFGVRVQMVWTAGPVSYGSGMLL